MEPFRQVASFDPQSLLSVDEACRSGSAQDLISFSGEPPASCHRPWSMDEHYPAVLVVTLLLMVILFLVLLCKNGVDAALGVWDLEEACSQFSKGFSGSPFLLGKRWLQQQCD